MDSGSETETESVIKETQEEDVEGRLPEVSSLVSCLKVSSLVSCLKVSSLVSCL